jgi:hypothetical protein
VKHTQYIRLGHSHNGISEWIDADVYFYLDAARTLETPHWTAGMDLEHTMERGRTYACDSTGGWEMLAGWRVCDTKLFKEMCKDVCKFRELSMSRQEVCDLFMADGRYALLLFYECVECWVEWEVRV